ncbi:phosphoglycerate kinase [Patescibacteria group bacterium]|nr:phosphoglycerate kinase [Patescibacteria group bacterium]
MKLKSIKQIKNLTGKKVLLRVDFNVPLTGGKNPKVAEDMRITESLPTLKYLLNKKAILILVSSLGRPNGVRVPELSIKPVAKKLEQLLGKKVLITPDCISDETKKIIDSLKPGEIVMMENAEYHSEEKNNDVKFSKRLASFADIYINEAFAKSHRAYATMVGVPKFLPSYAGFLLEKEIKELSHVFNHPKRPFVALIGGVKISTKLGVIKNLLKIADDVMIGGALANTVLKAKGISVGRSIVEEDMVKALRKLKLTDTHLHIPVDVIVSDKMTKNAKAKVKAAGNIAKNEYALDIGPDTLKLYDCIIRESRTIIWNGPMGMFENPKFASGTVGVIHAVVHSSAKIIIGGGETAEAIKSLKSFMHFERSNIYISTGGGAMLKFLEDKTLVALKPLIKK